MPRVRWADLGPEDAVAPAEAGPPQAVEDAWGPEDEPQAAEDTQLPTRTVSQAQQSALAALLAAAQRQSQQQDRPRQSKEHLQLPKQPSAPPQPQQRYVHHVPSLHKMCMTVLGQHVTELVEQLGGQLQWLPQDVRAALLAVARRRGEVTSALLSSLADDSWVQLDLSGCAKLFASEILAVAPRLPRLTALDVTGCEHISAGGWRQMAHAWPHLEVVRLGGTAVCSQEALKALPHILPGVPLPPHKAAAAAISSGVQLLAAAADSWEDAFASSDSDEEQDATGAEPQASCRASSSSSSSVSGSGSGDNHHGAVAAAKGTAVNSSSSSVGGRLKHLQALIWPDVPSAAIELVQQRCPRVLVNPELKPNNLTGQLPPREWHPAPLDEPCMEMVTAAALQASQADRDAAAASHAQQQEPVVHIADRFMQAYIDRARRLKEKEQRLAAAEQRKQLKASHALRTLDAWLDERE